MIHIRLDDRPIEHWKCAIPVEERLTFSNVLNVTNREPAKIKTFHLYMHESLTSATIIENNDASLHCIAVGYPMPRIILYKDDNAIGGEYQVIPENNVTIQLKYKLTPALRNHSGEYTCVASNAHGKSQQAFYLDVLYPPTVVSMEAENIKEGESLNKTCMFQHGNPQETDVRWIRAGSTLSNEILLIQKVARTDAGVYTCIASNTVEHGLTNFTGVHSQKFYLHVSYQPVVQIFIVESFNENSNVTVTENASIVFYCVGEGFPPPDIRLMKDNIKLDEREVDRQSNMSTRLRYNITSVRSNDMGQYACVASNKIGLGGRELMLNVLYPVRRFLTDQNLSNNENVATIPMGGNVSFTFAALANPLPTRSDYSWRKCIDANPCTEITSSSRVYISMKGENINLKMENITESDYGMYLLQVGNGVGKPHTEMYYLNQPLVQQPNKAAPGVNLLAIILAGSSATVAILIILVIACVCRHRRQTTTRENIDLPLVLSTIPAFEETVVPYATSPLEDQSDIYYEIDPQLSISEMPLGDDGARYYPQLSSEAGRNEELDFPEQSEDPQYITAVAD